MDKLEEMLGQALDDMVDEEMEIRERERESYNKALEEFSELVKSHLSIQGSFGSEDADTIKNQLKLK